MILERIIETTRQRVAEEKSRTPLNELKTLVDNSGHARDFRGALLEGSDIKLIAEIKRASPSKGPLCPDLDVTSLVQSYSQAGAAAVSILTEPVFFKGSFADLSQARKAVNIPLLCKDFIVDPHQVYQARLHGADCVLLIIAALSSPELEDLLRVAHSLGIAALVEVHNEQEMEKAIAVGARIIGINNRNLADFSTDLGTTSRLAQSAPGDVILVGESGIRSRADVLSMQEAGVNAVLVGETLVTSSDPAAKIQELLGS